MRVDAVKSRAELKTFIHLPFRLYRGDPNWVPPLLIGEWERFNPKKNPFYEHAEMALFLARQDGKVAGRVAAIDDRLHNETHKGDNLAFFGFFEAEDPETATALLEAVAGWARARGRGAVRGPVNPSMNDSPGLLIDGFHESPLIMMPYNPPRYGGYIEAAGYAKAKDLYAWVFDITKGVTERLSRLAAYVKRRHRPVVRPVNMKDATGELAKVKRLYNEAWEKNWGFVKYTDAEFAHLAKELKMIVDPDGVLFLEVDGETAGLALGLPDLNQVLKRVNGRLLPFGIFKLLNRKRYITQGRLAILGLLPQYRNRGLEVVLIDEIARRGLKNGYKRAECSWVLEDNEAMNKGIEAAGAERYKTYRIYQKAL